VNVDRWAGEGHGGDGGAYSGVVVQPHALRREDVGRREDGRSVHRLSRHDQAKTGGPRQGCTTVMATTKTKS
jgi:hypothetical protein